MNIKLITLSLFVALSFNAQVFSMNWMHYDDAQMNTFMTIMTKEDFEALHKYAFEALQNNFFDEMDLYYGDEEEGVEPNEKEAIESSKKKVLQYLANLDNTHNTHIDTLVELLKSNDENVRKSVDIIIERALIHAISD